VNERPNHEERKATSDRIRSDPIRSDPTRCDPKKRFLRDLFVSFVSSWFNPVVYVTGQSRSKSERRDGGRAIMAEVAKSGQALLEEIAATNCGPGQGAFWWLGQHSFIVKAGSTVIYIDPYLAESPARQTPPLLKPEAVTNANFVLCTHDHSDHIDPVALPGIAAASPGARFVTPRPTTDRVRALGIPEGRHTPIGALESIDLAGGRLTAVKAKHEFFDEDPRLGFPYLGYVIELNGVTLYHAGDTLIYDGLLTTLQRWRLDVAFLPINGRDAERYRRNVLGNMTFQEAVDLAGELEVGLAVPAHYEMFPGNMEDPRKFTDYLAAKFPGRRAWVGPAGSRVQFGRDDT
jgi:L-ascorbate metabolism protein UlaG (beta-lactamase superfamily)